MAENKLEGFEDFDNAAAGGEKAAGAGGELDDLLGKGEGAAEGGDSELDSFFEDLSTIDDLEVTQEAPKAAPAAPAAPAAAAPSPRQEAAPAPRAPRKPKAPSPPGRLRKILTYVVLLAIFGGAGYYVYTTYIAGDGKIPWPVFKLPTKSAPPPPPVEEPPPPPRPRAPAPKPVKAPPKPMGPGFGIQVATCFFDACVESYRALLEEQHLQVRVKERMSQSETLEVYTQTAYATRDVAQEAAERVNLENRLEGHAYVIEEGKAFRLSMGAFQDLARANVVKDTLNQRYGGQIVFGQRVKSVPYALKVVQAGRYPTRADAEQAVETLRALDRSLSGVFVIPNEK